MNSNSTVMISLVSAQPIPNLIPLYQEAYRFCRKVILMQSPDMEVQGKNQKKVIKSINGIEVEIHSISPYDCPKAKKDIQKALDGYKLDQICLNITGGTKIMALAAYAVLGNTEAQIIYVDTHNDRIININTAQTAPMRGIIDVDTYLAAYGVVSKENKNYSGRPQFDFSKEFLSPDLHIGFDKMIVSAKQHGIEIDNGRCFEAYIYSIVEKIGVDDLKTGWEIRLDNQDQTDPSNELDVVFTKNHRLYLIECKSGTVGTTKDAKTVVYKLDSIGKYTKGLFGRSMLISPKANYQTERLSLLGCSYISSGYYDEIEQYLRQWIDEKRKVAFVTQRVR